MIEKREHRGHGLGTAPVHLQNSRANARSGNRTGLRRVTQAGCIGTDDTADQLPIVIVGPVIDHWCLVKFRGCEELDQLIRNVIDKPHRKWSNRLDGWRVRSGHVGVLLAALYQRGVEIVDVRRAASA